MIKKKFVGWVQLRHEMTLCRVYVILRNFGSFDRRPIGNMASRYRTSQEQYGGNSSSQEVKMIHMDAIVKCSESSVVLQEDEEEDFDDHMNIYATTGLTMVKNPEPFSGLERLINFQVE